MRFLKLLSANPKGKTPPSQTSLDGVSLRTWVTPEVEIGVHHPWVGGWVLQSIGWRPVLCALAARLVEGTCPGNAGLVLRLVGMRDLGKHCVGKGMKWAENEVKEWVCETPGWAMPGCLEAAFQRPPLQQLTCPERPAVPSTRTRVPWQSSGGTACLSLALGPGCGLEGQLLPMPRRLGTPQTISRPRPVPQAGKDHLALCSPRPLNAWKGLIQGQDP